MGSGNSTTDGVGTASQNFEVVITASLVGLVTVVCLFGCGCYRFYDRNASESRRVHPRTAADRAAERERRLRAVAPKVHALPQLGYQQNYGEVDGNDLLESSSAMRWAASCGASTSRLGSPSNGNTGNAEAWRVENINDCDARDVVSAGGVVFDEIGGAQGSTHAEGLKPPGTFAPSAPPSAPGDVSASQRALFQAAARKSGSCVEQVAMGGAPRTKGSAKDGGRGSSTSNLAKQTASVSSVGAKQTAAAASSQQRQGTLAARRGVPAAGQLQLDPDDFIDPNPPAPARVPGSSPDRSARPTSRGMVKSNSSFLVRKPE